MSDEDLEEMRRLRQASNYVRPYETKDDTGGDATPNDIYASLPMSFGKKAKAKPVVDHDRFSHTNTATGARDGAQADAGDAVDSDEDVADKRVSKALSGDLDVRQAALDKRIPATHSAIMKAHGKAVSCICIDRHGARMVTGGYDYVVKFWQFSGMNRNFKSFRQVEPLSGYQVMALDYSFNAQLFICATTAICAKLYDKDGYEKETFIKGDGYIYDMRKTKGHTAPLTDAQFVKNENDLILTSSSDGTVRKWHVKNVAWQQDKTAVAKDKKGKKIPILCLTQNDKLVGGGCQDGTVQLWASNGPFQRPTYKIKAHTPGEQAITRVSFSPDGRLVATRSRTDHAVALWDIRKARSPVWRVDNLDCVHETTSVGFAPLAGCVSKKGRVDAYGDPMEVEPASDGGSGVVFAAVGAKPGSSDRGGVETFDVVDGRRLGKLELDAGVGAVAATWDAALQQMFVGQTNGDVRAFYRPGVSRNGIVLSLSKGGKRKAQQSVLPPAQIVLPNAHEAFTDEPSRKKQYKQDRQDRRKTRRPDVGDKKVLQALRDPNSASQMGAGGGAVAKHLVERGEFAQRSFRAQDPREALLKYANAADDGKSFIAGAYKKTQPVTMFTYEEEQVEEEESEDDEALQK